MKKLLMVLILLFPVVTLLWWVRIGMSTKADPAAAGSTNTSSIRIEQTDTNQTNGSQPR
jgi:hypothetical protein